MSEESAVPNDVSRNTSKNSARISSTDNYHPTNAKYTNPASVATRLIISPLIKVAV